MTGFTESKIMKGNLFLLFAFAAGFCCIAGSLCADEGLADNDLVTPEMTSQEPAAGRRVRQVAPEYKGTEVYHALYLPIGLEAGR